MIRLSELLEPQPTTLWALVKQCGVDDAVALMEGAEQQSRWLRGDATNRGLVRGGTATPWSLEGLSELQQRFAAHGLNVIAIEDTPPMDDIRIGGPKAEEQTHQVHEQIRAMGALGINVLCYNWMAFTSWARTDVAIPARGGALTTGFDLAAATSQPALTSDPTITPERLWSALDRFLDITLPVAEKAGVKLALHPDDPPLQAMRGVPRIINSPAAYQRLLDEHPSASNCITFCQGNWGLMTDDLPATITRFLPHIAFVHFRDVRGDVTNFVETFHDNGPTDLAECMRLYVEGGFDGPMRPDHVPTLAGEANDRPGYATLGRLFALGYIRGLEHAQRSH
jgi:mannonate dehydratase